MEVSQLADNMQEARLLVREIHTPWRAKHDPNSMTSKAPTGQPGAPLKAAAIDLEAEVYQVLYHVAAGAVTAIEGNLAAIPRDSLTLCGWLRKNAMLLAPHVDDSDAMDLAIVLDRLRQHHGYTTAAQERAVRLAETRGKLGTTSATTATAESLSRLMGLRGTPVHASTIRRWGRQGYVGFTTYDDGSPTEFNINDVRELLEGEVSSAA